MIDPIDLHAFVDGELGAEREAEIRAELEASPSQQQEVDAIRRLKSMVLAHSAPLEFKQAWKGCVSRLDELDKAKRVDRIVSRFAPALCGVFFVCILVAGFMARHHDANNSSNQNLARLIGRFSKTPARSDVYDPDFLHRIVAQSHESTPEDPRIRLISKGWIDGIPATRSEWRDASGSVDIYVIAEHVDFDGMTAQNSNGAVQIGRLSNGRNVVVRMDDPCTIIVIADRSIDELTSIASGLTIK